MMPLEEIDELACSLTGTPTMGATLQPAPGQHFNPPTWFGAIDPEFLYEVSESITLDQTNWASYTWITSAKGLTYPATAYTSAAQKSVYDRYGVDYHDGVSFDFKQYNYMILAEAFVDFHYTSNEASMGKDHTITAANETVFYLGKNIKVNANTSGTITHPTGTTSTNYGTTLKSAYTNLFFIYRRSNGKFSSSTTASGLYPGWPTDICPLPNNAYDTATFLHIYRPYWYGIDNTSVMDAAARALIDPETTTLKWRQRIYRVPKPCIAENMMERIAYMHENKALPPETR